MAGACTGRTGQAIVNGVDSTERGVVSFEKKNCSGVFIGPRLIATAWHCTQEFVLDLGKVTDDKFAYTNPQESPDRREH